MERLADGALVAKAREGEEAAFSELYARYAPALARRLRLILPRKEDAQDVLQLTFLEAYRNLGRFRTDASFEAWLHGICFNVTGRHLRAGRRRWWLRHVAGDVSEDAPAVATMAAPTVAVDEEVAVRQLAERLRGALLRLPSDQRIAFALCEIDGVGLREAAELLSTSPKTVWGRVAAARKRIQKMLRHSGGL